MASVYLDQNGLTLLATFTFTSDSGDWALFTSYYFRSDGTLAKKHERLNTFYGGATVIRDMDFGCRGEVIGATKQHLGLTSQQPEKPDPDFIDETPPLFKRARDLPFFALLAAIRHKIEVR